MEQVMECKQVHLVTLIKGLFTSEVRNKEILDFFKGYQSNDKEN